jgi:hypothetical protein
MAEGRHQEALESFQAAKRFAGAARSASSPPLSPRYGSCFPWLALIAAESGSGEGAAACVDLQKFFITSRTWGSMAAIEKWPAFAANPKLLDGLRHAGMPAD